MQKLIECVPNFSEGTNKDTIEAIASEIKSVKDIKLLDYSSDPDHNRSVYTFTGSPESIAEAAFISAKKAVELINIFEHKGVHPKIGAVDVIPFIPLANATIDDCVQIAQKLGKRIELELNVPVYLYGEAAIIEGHRNLADIRRGGLANFKGKLHPTAGAVAVGARDFLIAFNVNLDSDNLEIAKSIAKKIRLLPCVKAIGVELASKGMIQVSMNLVNYRETGMKKAFDAVTNEAKKLEVKIKNSEIIGLIPKAAVFDDMKNYLKLDGFSDKKVLDSCF